MGKVLEKYRVVSSEEAPMQLDLLRSLAHEIAVVAAATREGCQAHVVGRAHLKCAFRSALHC